MKRLRGISIRQPFVEQIFAGIKKHEYRVRPTNIRERIYIYASLRPRHDVSWKGVKNRDRVPTGMVVGTVEIVACRGPHRGEYSWQLKAPRRLRKPIKPKQHPQPIWFYPFGRPKDSR